MPLALIDLPAELAEHTIVLLPPDPRDGPSELAAVLAVGSPYDLVRHLLDQCDPGEELNQLKLYDASRAQRRILRRRQQAALDRAAEADRDEPEPVYTPVVQAWFDAAAAEEHRERSPTAEGESP